MAIDENKFIWEGNTADGKPATVIFEQIVDQLDPDGDPDVRITLLQGTTTSKQLAVVLPGNALLAYVAELIRNARIDELQEMEDEEVLGFPSYDYNDGGEEN